jgi:hypothetical protein
MKWKIERAQERGRRRVDRNIAEAVRDLEQLGEPVPEEWVTGVRRWFYDYSDDLIRKVETARTAARRRKAAAIIKLILGALVICGILYVVSAAGLDLVDNDATRWAGRSQPQTQEQTEAAQLLGWLLLGIGLASSVIIPVRFMAGYRRGP